MHRDVLDSSVIRIERDPDDPVGSDWEYADHALRRIRSTRIVQEADNHLGRRSADGKPQLITLGEIDRLGEIDPTGIPSYVFARGAT